MSEGGQKKRAGAGVETGKKWGPRKSSGSLDVGKR